MSERADPAADEWVVRLAQFFRQHPVWREAAVLLDEAATSDVYFRHLPGARFHLRRVGDHAELREGAARDPDLVLRFTPEAVADLTAVEGGIGDFALVLFEHAVDPDPARRVDIRILAGFLRLWQRGYVRLLLAGGPRLVEFGARHGVPDLASLRRLIRDLSRREPAEWEAPEGSRCGED